MRTEDGGYELEEPELCEDAVKRLHEKLDKLYHGFDYVLTDADSDEDERAWVKGWQSGVEHAEEYIKSAMVSVGPKRKPGKWVVERICNFPALYRYECSECGMEKRWRRQLLPELRSTDGGKRG